MSPEDFAARRPRLFHVTEEDALEGVARRGLLSASRLLDLFGYEGERRRALERTPRGDFVELGDPRLGRAVLSDNRPLNLKALAACLDGASPEEWLAILNARAFFWASETDALRHLSARANRGRRKVTLVVDALGLARRHGARLELCPINSGATRRRPARRGPSIFTPLEATSFEGWRRLRGGRDALREVAVRDAVEDLRDFLLEVRRAGRTAD
ncbi:hypothetical protein [Methylocella sp.]|uniref:DUF7002 family protein n=1 Tax=Methylocella sp. TaxID=1978226 RepID=UPI0035B1C17E